MPEQYYWFSSTCGNDTLVAMSYVNDQSVRVHRMLGDRLEDSRIELNKPRHLMWLADRLLVSEDSNSHSLSELAENGTRLESRRELIDNKEHKLYVWSLCVVDDAIVKSNSNEILLYPIV